ncbi:MAG: MFS transporter [Acetobacterales bacterium]
MRLLVLALVAMFVQQAVATMSKVIVPVISPAILDRFDVSPALVGVFVAIAASFSMVSTMGCGGLFRRYGALRMSQVSLLLIALGMSFAAFGMLWPLVLTAAIAALGTAMATPASSHLLARYSPPGYGPLVFSLKQTSVPAGLMMAGLLMPFLVGLWGWQAAMLVNGALCAALALALQPSRAAFDNDRKPDHRLSIDVFRSTFMTVISTPGLGLMAFASFGFVGLQAVFTSFFVLNLNRSLGYDLAAAGAVFATATAVAVPARILWGWVGSRLVAPRLVLAMLGIGAALATFGFAAYDAGWSTWAVLAVAICYAATGLSWHGVLLSEVARLAPPGQAGAMTGGVLSFSSAGQMLLPLLFGGVLELTGTFATGFALTALPALAAGLIFLRRPPPETASVTETTR